MGLTGMPGRRGGIGFGMRSAGMGSMLLLAVTPEHAGYLAGQQFHRDPLAPPRDSCRRDRPAGQKAVVSGDFGVDPACGAAHILHIPYRSWTESIDIRAPSRGTSG